MNWHHFQALLWVRWRLLVNQLRRGGPVNAAAAVFLAAMGVMAAFAMFFSFLFIGLYAFSRDYPDAMLYVWDGLVVAFIFSWMIGLLIELQRSEVLSIDKLMHLPVSLKGAFLINYLSSYFSLSLIVFVPAMVALSLGVMFTYGPTMLIVLPLLAAFIVMVTGLTYQFQGWLATLMSNPRRRRTVIVMMTMGVILTGQIPNLINIIIRPWEKRADPVALEFKTRQDNLDAAWNDREIDDALHAEMQLQLDMEKTAHEREAKLDLEQTFETSFVIGNAIVPPGWLPLGAEFAAKQNVLPGLLGTLGFAGVAWFSLWRAYQTTVRLYTGQFTAGKKAAVPAIETAPVAKKTLSAPRLNLMEWQLPWVSEPTAAVALSGFRSLVRAPEAKMMLLSPLIMLVVFGSLFMSYSLTASKDSNDFVMPAFVAPLIAYGAMSMALLSIGQFVGNQFGFDRGGFRVFVLSAAPRRDILLGKNLAFAPIGLGLGLFVIVLVEVVFRSRIDVFLAQLPQLLSMYMLFSMVANWLSILAPMPIRAGTMKPANPKVAAVMLHVLSVMLYPVVLAPVLLPLGAHLFLEEVVGIRYLPVDLVLSVILCVLVFFLYQVVLTWEGEFLRRRELKILDATTAKTE